MTSGRPYVEAVLALVERIPPGRVMSYGAIAEYLADEFGRGSARRVGTIMAQYGGAVPWYRVVNGGGRLPPGHEAGGPRPARGRRCALRVGTKRGICRVEWSALAAGR